MNNMTNGSIIRHRSRSFTPKNRVTAVMEDVIKVLNIGYKSRINVVGLTHQPKFAPLQWDKLMVWQTVDF